MAKIMVLSRVLLLLTLSLSAFSFAQGETDASGDSPEVDSTGPHNCLGGTKRYGTPSNLVSQLQEFEAILQQGEPRQLRPWLQKNLRNWETSDLYCNSTRLLNPSDRTDFLEEILNFKAQTAKPPNQQSYILQALNHCIPEFIACGRRENLKLLLSKFELFFGKKPTLADLRHFYVLYSVGTSTLNSVLGQSAAESLLKIWQRPSVYRSIQECQSGEKTDYTFNATEVVRGKVLAVNRLAKPGVVTLSVEVLATLLGSSKTGTKMTVMWPEIDREFGVVRPPPAIGSDILLPLRKLKKDWPYFSQCPLFYSESNRIAWLNQRPKALVGYSKKNCLENRSSKNFNWLDERTKSGLIRKSKLSSFRFKALSGQEQKLEAQDSDGEGSYTPTLTEISCEHDIIRFSEGYWEAHEESIFSLISGKKLVGAEQLVVSPDHRFALAIYQSDYNADYSSVQLKLIKIDHHTPQTIWDMAPRSLRFSPEKDGQPRFLGSTIRFKVRQVINKIPNPNPSYEGDPTEVYKVKILEVTCTADPSPHCSEKAVGTAQDEWTPG